MMKVTESVSNHTSIVGTTEKDEKKANSTKQASFQSKLRQIEDTNVESRLNELAEQISKQGEKLGKNVDIRELKVYKKMISEFLDMAINKSRKFSKQSFLDRRGRHRVYAVIKNINTQLDELTKEVLKEENDNIQILKRLDDIKGLILDMIL